MARRGALGLAVLAWLGLLASPAVERLLPEGWPLPLGLALLALGAGMARRWERLPGAGALARLGEADPFSRRVIALTLGFYLGLRAILLLDGSFGADYDSFRVANAAALVWREGRYQVSRFPGYPVPEIALSPLVALGGPVLAKLGAAAVGFGALFAFDRLGRALGAPRMGLVTLTLATAPMFVVQTSGVMDYVFALGALLAALLAVARGGAARGGLWIGLGFACRITTAIYGLPMLLLARARGASGPRLVAMAATGALTGLTLYAPTWVTYGRRALTFSDVPSDLDHASTAALGAFGLWPLLAVGLLLGDALRPSPAVVAVADRSALALAAALGCVAFGMMPLDAGYLLPPLTLGLLLAGAVSRPAPLGLLLVAGLVSLMSDEGRGSLAFEHGQRARQLSAYALARSEALPPGAVLVLGGGELAVMGALGQDLEPMDPHGPWRGALRDPETDVRYLRRLSEATLRHIERDGREIYLIRASLDRALSRALGASLLEGGARVLRAGEAERELAAAARQEARQAARRQLRRAQKEADPRP